MKRAKGFLMSKSISGIAEQLSLFAMPALAADIKAMTCPDNDIIFYLPTLTPKSSQTLEVDSTSKGKVYSPYWNELCKGINSRLLLPTRIDLLDSGSISFDGWSSTTVDQSWFSTIMNTAPSKSLLPIFSPSLRSSVLELTDSEDMVRKSKKIRLYLSKQQQQMIDRWFGVARYVYNQTVEYLRQPETKANWKAIKGGILDSLPEFCADVPYQIKSIAVRDACIAVREAKKKYMVDQQVREVKFRSCKNPVQSCYIPKSAVKADGIYYTILGGLRYGEQLPADFGDCRLVRASGRYYLTVPTESQRQLGENQARVVALDPGVRTFQTFLSESSFGKLGIDSNLVIQKLCFRLDDLISRMSKANSRKRKSMQVAADRLRRRIRCKVDELHHKTARFLVDNFDVILLPTFETQQMADKAKRRIRSKSVRQMLGLAHYRFKQFIKHKAFECGKLVLDVCEAYTSKTVSWTGEIVHNLGGAKVIQSKMDGRKMDRDLNGARGIFLRAVVDTPLLNSNLNNYHVSES